MSNGRVFTFAEVAFVKTLITIKKNLNVVNIISCGFILFSGVILANIIGNIVQYLFENILKIDNNTFKKSCVPIKFNGTTIYMKYGRNSFPITHSRIILVSRLIKLSIISITLSGCALAFTETIGNITISMFGFIVIASSTIKSSLGAGIWILVNNEIQRGDVIFFDGYNNIYLQVKEIGWMNVICNDISEIVEYIESDFKKQEKVRNSTRQKYIPNSDFLSNIRGFFWISKLIKKQN